MIRKIENKYYVFSEKGRKLSKGYSTKDDAIKRLKEIEYWKNKK
jgi:hypothetical protein